MQLSNSMKKQIVPTFLQLEDLQGQPVLVSASDIISIIDSPNYVRINMIDNESIRVVQTFASVVSKLENCSEVI